MEKRSPGSKKDSKSTALKFLSHRARSVREVKDKLVSKGFQKEAVDSTIDYLKSAGYLDDRVFAKELATSRARIKNWGSLKIASELLSRGVASEVIKKVLDEVASGDEKNASTALAKWVKRNGVAKPFDKKVSLKAYRFLKSRGFPAPAAINAIKGCGAEEDFEENFL